MTKPGKKTSSSKKRNPLKIISSSKMRNPVKKPSSSNEAEETNVQQPEQRESSRSKGKEKMLEVQGKASLHQPKEGGQKGNSVINQQIWIRLEKLEAELKFQKDTNKELKLDSRKTASELDIKRLESEIAALEQERLISKVGVLKLELEIEKLKSKDTAWELGIETDNSVVTALELGIETHNSVVTALEQGIEKLKSWVTDQQQGIDRLKSEETALERKIDGNKSRITVLKQDIEELKSEREIDGNKSRITDLEQDIEGLKGSMQENTSMDIDGPKDGGSPMEIDPPEGKIDALFPFPPPKELATNKLIIQSTGNSQTEVSEYQEQILAVLKKMKAYDSQLAYLEKEIASLRAQRESRAVNAEGEDSANQAKDTADDDN